jgi:hypothetical protein
MQRLWSSAADPHAWRDHHGKEGVAGSSPAEGSQQCPAKGHFLGVAPGILPLVGSGPTAYGNNLETSGVRRAAAAVRRATCARGRSPVSLRSLRSHLSPRRSVGNRRLWSDPMTHLPADASLYARCSLPATDRFDGAPAGARRLPRCDGSAALGVASAWSHVGSAAWLRVSAGESVRPPGWSSCVCGVHVAGLVPHSRRSRGTRPISGGDRSCQDQPVRAERREPRSGGLDGHGSAQLLGSACPLRGLQARRGASVTSVRALA